MIISDFYQTKIEAFDKQEYDKGNGFVSCYSLDSTGTKKALIIKVSLIDFNNQPVRNKEVELSVNKGAFTLKDIVTSKTFINVKNNRVIKGTTGNDGAIYVPFGINPSEIGICTFSANNIVIQVDNMNPYPVGSIYMSINNTNPASLFGGEWVQLKDRFLLGAGSTYTNGTVGGEASHKLSQNEMPSHTHEQNAHNHTNTSKDSGYKYLLADGNIKVNGTYRTKPSTKSDDWYFVYNEDAADIIEAVNTEKTTATNKNTGGGVAHNNMPPYLVVYIWKRTA